MIGRLTGRLASKATDHVLLDVAGVGYLVHIPLSTFYELPEAEGPASLWIIPMCGRTLCPSMAF